MTALAEERTAPVSALHHRQATTSLDKLAAELVLQQDSKHDMVIDTRKIGWTTDHDGHTYVTVDGAESMTPAWDGDERTGGGGHHIGWRVNDHAHSQVSAALEIPARYYHRLRKDAPGLLDTNVRHWLTQTPKKRMLRTLDGKLRAYVSNSYQRRDNFDLLEFLIPVFGEIEGLTFHVASLTDTHMYLRVVCPRIEREVKVGDVVQCGVEIRNSEVGAGLLDVRPYVWRLICLNGMVMPSAFSVRHVGRRITNEDLNLRHYRAETLAADDRAFFMKVADVVRGTLTDTQFDLLVAPMIEAAGGTPAFDPPATVEHLCKTFDVTEDERGSVLRLLTQGGDLSQWGMVNAFTAAAKEAESFDRLVELEQVGGEVLALSGDEWRKAARV